MNYTNNSKRKMKKLLNFTVENNIMTASKCDRAMNQLFEFVNNVKKNSAEFCNFDKAKNSCFKMEKAKELNFLLKLIFTRSHGKSSVVRGFSVNNLILENNMKAESIIAHRFIKDYLIANELSSHTFEINNDLILSVKKAKGRYQQELEGKKSCKEKK